MKITKIKNQTSTIKTRLREVILYSFTSKNGNPAEIITLKTDDGNFSGYMSTWCRQFLPTDDLPEGVEVEITYTVCRKGDREFKNFQTVRIAEEAK